MTRVLATAILIVLSSPTTAQPSDKAAARYNDMFGAWSPDGSMIAFTSDRSGDPEIYVSNSDGSGLNRLTYSEGRDAHPSWSSDGRSLLFQSPRDGGDVRIFSMKADGNEQRSLTATKGFCGVPSWSREGRRIAFQCSASVDGFGTPEAPWRIFVLGRGQSVPTAASRGPGNDQVPAWSRDGSKLLFFSDRDGTDQLYEMKLSTGAIRRITSGPASHSSASYSPDGRQIALMRSEPGEKADVYVLQRQTGQMIRITTSGPQFGTPAWSPDGKQLMIQMPTEVGVRLFAVSSDGTGKPRMISFR